MGMMYLRGTLYHCRVEWKLFPFLIFYNSCVSGYVHILIRHWHTFLNILKITKEEEELLKSMCHQLAEAGCNKKKIAAVNHRVAENKKNLKRLIDELHEYFIKLVNEKSKSMVYFTQEGRVEIWLYQRNPSRDGFDRDIKGWKIITSDETRQMELITMYTLNERAEKPRIEVCYDCEAKTVISSEVAEARKEGCFIQFGYRVLCMDVFLEAYQKLNNLATQKPHLRPNLRRMLSNHVMNDAQSKKQKIIDQEWPALPGTETKKTSNSRAAVELPRGNCWAERARRSSVLS